MDDSCEFPHTFEGRRCSLGWTVYRFQYVVLLQRFDARVRTKLGDGGTSITFTIRLLRYVFTNATDVPEFQRQVSTPNVPKFSLALINLADKHEDQDVKLVTPNSYISHLTSRIARILIHPFPTLPQWFDTKTYDRTAIRSRVETIFCLTSYWREGWFSKPLEKISRRHTIICMGSIHEHANDISKCWYIFGSIFLLPQTHIIHFQGQGQIVPLPLSLTEDPIAAVPFNLDRLRAAVQVLVDLIQ
ncbi:hypothetical protein PHLCEN_2v1567 [Hermanssonia centrifuga]|uniref:Pre-rRNA-processing protein RIX1 N-terminal domain-containing protein n=1 Tax=Hermanssonia centrifuga TaxID=98765 RepID=A0A2R6RZE5_9APHY|nr:hypothetical protein PHLCEN_2v1567 [Hermanssonia centrifuga]